LFGYISPHKPELKVKELELFNAFYCGVCQSIKRRYGNIPRLVLSYDSVFFAILFHSLSEDKPVFDKRHCIVHPVKKKFMVTKNDIIDYAADINLILTYFNLEDDKRDKESSFASNAGLLFLTPIYKKLKQKYSEKCDIIEKRLNELIEIEKSGCDSVDKVMEPFAKIIEEVVIYKPVCSDEKTEKILRWLGYNLGKWLYLIDAYDDMEHDAKKGLYNPLLMQFKDDIKTLKNNDSITELKNKLKERVEFNLIYCLSQIGKAYELLEIKNSKGLLENIIYQGMLVKTENILGTRSCGQVESI